MTSICADCTICEKHRGRGPLVGPVLFEDDIVVVSHCPPNRDDLSIPGYLFVETRRHAGNLATLTEIEAVAVARAVWRAARAIENVMAPEYVHTMVAGRSVAHFHEHVFTWPEPSRIGSTELAALCSQLRSQLS